MSKLQQIIQILYSKMRPVATVSNSVGMVALAGIMFLTAIDVIMRKTLNMPIVGSYELIQLMMAVCVGLGLAHCGLKKGHVNIDLIVSHFPRRTQGIIGIITGIMGIAIIGITTWQACIYVGKIVSSKLASTVLYIPIFPFVLIVALGFIMYFVVLIIHFLEYLKEGMAK